MMSDRSITFEESFRRSTTQKALPSLGDVFCLVAPLLQFVQIQFVGVLQATDVILLAALPVAVIRHPERLRQKPVPTILTLGTLWLVSQILTDIVRVSAPEDYLRGWSKIILILVSFTVLWTVVCTTRRRFILYGIGTALGGILTLYVRPTEQMLDSPWKFGLANPLTLLVIMCVALGAKRRYLAILLPLIMLAVIHAFANTRSLAMLCILTAIYCVFSMSTAYNRDGLGGRRLALLGGVVGVAIWGFAVLYSHYALQGVFGEYAQHKLEAQTGEGGLLLGGRGEILASGQAILDSPVLGHGSWARDPIYAAILAENRAELGYKAFQSGKRGDLIPAHSHIFGAWVEAGMAGALFWFFVVIYAIRSMMRVSGLQSMLPLFAFAGFALVWDVLFSPISPERRLVTPYFLVAMIMLRVFWTEPSVPGWES
jgi:hypothetical protein